MIHLLFFDMLIEINKNIYVDIHTIIMNSNFRTNIEIINSNVHTNLLICSYEYSYAHTN